MEVLEKCLPIFNRISEVLISNAGLRDLSSQSFRIKDSRKCFFVESFKRVSVLHKLSPFLLVPSLERSRITVWRRKNFEH